MTSDKDNSRRLQEMGFIAGILGFIVIGFLIFYFAIPILLSAD